MELLTLWLSSALLLYLTAMIVPGFKVSSFPRSMLATVIVGLFNALLRPFLLIITIPINILTLGLFTFVVNAIILRLAAGLIKGFDIKGWGPAIIGAITMVLLQISAKLLFN